MNGDLLILAARLNVALQSEETTFGIYLFSASYMLSLICGFLALIVWIIYRRRNRAGAWLAGFGTFFGLIMEAGHVLHLSSTLKAAPEGKLLMLYLAPCILPLLCFLMWLGQRVPRQHHD